MRAELLALLVPPRCAACRSSGLRPEESLCGACRRALPWLEGPTCPQCALGAPCAPCPARRAAFAAAWAAVAYEGVARDALRALKFAAARPLARDMAAQIAAGAPAGTLSPDRVLVAVPAHPARRRARGFDPAELIARELARRTGQPVARALRRRGPAAARQLGASRATRLEPGRIAVVARGPAPRHAVLVDDVHTTGATLDACARALLEAGADTVAALTWARTLPLRRAE